MEVAIDPNLAFILLLNLLHQAFDSDNLWVKKRLRIDPLAIEVYTCD
jgi:hypothetical protein